MNITKNFIRNKLYQKVLEAGLSLTEKRIQRLEKDVDEIFLKLSNLQEKDYEEAPYKNIKELPENIKNSLTKELQEIWMKVFNEALERYKDEDIARKVAWNLIKKISKKNKNGKWVRINKS